MKNYNVQLFIDDARFMSSENPEIKMIDQHDKRLADAWRELFTDGQYEFDPIIAGEVGGDLSCFFCGAWFFDRDERQHSEDCIYMRVKAILLMEGTIKNAVD